ncbi:MAG: fibronectin type III domain-containing protein [Candidatus Saccharimonadales bacterium]
MKLVMLSLALRSRMTFRYAKAALRHPRQTAAKLSKHYSGSRVMRGGTIGVLVIAMVMAMVLPALQTRATTMTWSTNADFGFNRTGICGATTLTNVAINSSEKYSDANCVQATKDATLSLTKNPSSAGSLTGVSSIAAGGSHSLALLSDGTVWAWGSNANGQLGIGTITPQETPMQVLNSAGDNTFSDAISIAAGANFSLALKSDGTVWAWGSNANGQLGDNTNTSKVLPIQVVDGGAYMTDVTAIAAGASHALALKSDGSIWSWGLNNMGQLGDNTTTSRKEPVRVKNTDGGILSGVVSIAAGSSHSLAIRASNTAIAWGDGGNGRLGDGSAVNRSIPVEVKNEGGSGALSNIVELRGGTAFTLAKKQDGSVWAWGYNNNGQLGDGTTTARSLPARVKDSAGTGWLAGVVSISAANSHAIAVNDAGSVVAWGYNNAGQLGDNSVNTRTLPVSVKGVTGEPSLGSVVAIDAGGDSSSGTASHSLALRADGTVSAWGGNVSGQLGDGTVVNKVVPIAVREKNLRSIFDDAVQVVAGSNTSAVLRQDGSVWAWGYNYSGQLGNGTTSNSGSPVQVVTTSDVYLTGIKQLAASGNNIIALDNDGTVWSTGSYLGLGSGDYSPSVRAVKVKNATGSADLTNISSIAASRASDSSMSSHYAVKDDGTVWAWGSNNNGQLGDGTTTQRLRPIQVKDPSGTGNLTGVKQVTAGSNHTIAVKDDGTVWSWGYNGYGQLGDGTTTQRTLPVQVKDPSGTGNLTGVKQVTAGSYYTTAVKDDGTVWAWGNNNNGQLGDGTTAQRTLPVQVKDPSGTGNLTGVKQVAAGSNHTVAVKDDGTVWAWGSNSNGQISGSFQRYLRAVTVDGPPLSATVYFPEGNASGFIVDLGQGKKAQWHELTWKSQPLPAGAKISMSVRTSQDKVAWSAWSGDVSQAITATTTGSGSLESLPFSRYLEVRVSLMTANPTNTPILDEFSISHFDDVVPPVTNADAIVMKTQSGGTVVNDGDWNNSPNAVFDWTPAEDDSGGSGIAGYCLYLGHDESADVQHTKGLLGVSPLDTDQQCEYAVSSHHFSLADIGALDSPLASSVDPYYLKIKAIDRAGNVYTGNDEKFSFKYDVTAPKNLAFISLPSQFVSTKDITVTWPTSGGQSASDNQSGVAGLQYKIGDNGTWYGNQHSGSQDKADVIPIGTGNYRMDQDYDYPVLQEGNNIIYFRALDNAGNISETLTSGVIKLNTLAPSEPQSLTVTPPNNTTNMFQFSWQPPQTFVGSQDKVSYCYTINTLPSNTTCTYTSEGQTSLPSSSYATQPGSNMFYLVARDEAGNINYSTSASVAFTANTASPGIPLNLDIADISIKVTQNWKVALSWEKPASEGAGVARYQIWRSTSPTSGFTNVATTAGTSYVDSELDQVTYYYKVRACDSANHCSADSSSVSKLPTGRFTSPPEMISAPTVRIGTRSAIVNWMTDRNSDSRVQIGTTSGNYRASETANSALSKSHEIKVDGLEAGTTYYYRVRWTDEDGNIGTSSEQSFTTLPAPVVKNVSVVKTTLNSATVKFTSTDATAVRIQYGKTDSFGGLETVNTSVNESTYTVELTGLDDGATYLFRPTSTDRDDFAYPGDTYTFATPPRPRISNLRFQPIDGEPTSTQRVTWQTNVDATSVVSFGKVNKEPSNLYDGKMTKDHEVIVRDLEDDSDYFMIAQSRDGGGNMAQSDRQTFRTALDTRPPGISKINVETSTKGSGGDARGQVVVSWTTDEPATSQVAFGEGKSGQGYLSRTAENATLTTEHVVIISDLAPSKVYYVQPISRDKAGNATKGKDHAAIVGRASQSVLTIILDSLYKVFGVR